MSVVKEMFSRKRTLPMLLIIIIFFVWQYRKPVPLVAIEGQTFGTIAYHIKYKDKDQRNFKAQIDSLLIEFNSVLSHYDPTSALSRYNNDTILVFESDLFWPVLVKSKEIYELSHGAFNPAVMPLVNAWGFGPENSLALDSTTVDSLLTIVNFEAVEFNEEKVWKTEPRLQLDFSAIAKGYAVDQLAEYLRQQGIKDYFVEIGGEVISAGTNAKDKPWRIGIIDPGSDLLNQSFYATVDLKDRAIATSANNFNYVIKDGIRYSHTLSPTTGYPAVHSILSASVFADDCMTADAMATAFMAAGIDEAKRMLEESAEIDALLIYSDSEGQVISYATKGIEQHINYLEN
jgi:thiamine biosynthesis lipoprotein